MLGLVLGLEDFVGLRVGNLFWLLSGFMVKMCCWFSMVLFLVLMWCFSCGYCSWIE